MTGLGWTAGLLSAQGVRGCRPLRCGCRVRLKELRTGDGRPLPPKLKAGIEAACDALLVAEDRSPGKRLLQLRSIGPEIAPVLWPEGLWRRFGNRRQPAAFSGLAPSPWRSGKIGHEQGIAKSGSVKLRSTMIELAWLWLRYQPGPALSQWFQARVRGNGTRRCRKITIAAMARKLLTALWRYVTGGVVPGGAVMKAA